MAGIFNYTNMLTTITALVLCNNLNWTYSPRCNAPIAELHIEHNRFYGTLENGIPWEQKIITPTIHEFRMEDVHYYVINGEIVYINERN